MSRFGSTTEPSRTFDNWAIILAYIISLSIKLHLAAQPGESPEMWKNLLLVNILEAFVWAVWIVRRHGKEIGLILLPLPFVCSLYSSVSIALLAMGLDMYPFPDGAVREGMMLQAIMATHLWLFSGIFLSRRAMRDFHANTLSWFEKVQVTTRGIRIFLISGFAVAVFYIYDFYASGAAAMVATNGYREEINGAMESGRSWLVTILFISWVMTAAILSMSPSVRRKASAKHILCAAGIAVMFFSTYGRLGNRREAMVALLFICILLALKGKRKIIAMLLVGGVALGLFLGIARAFDSSAVSEMDAASFYTNLFSEAVLPNYPLLDHISSQKEPWLGSSYLRLPWFLMPTFGLWEKPQSLSEKFAIEYSGGALGYAYTPLGEGFANFGVWAVLTTPMLLVFGEWLLLKGWVLTPNPGFILVPGILFLSLPLNINRGEFVSIMLEIVLYSISIYIFLRIGRIGVERQRVYCCAHTDS